MSDRTALPVGVGPGGPRVSNAKKRRLQALEKSMQGSTMAAALQRVPDISATTPKPQPTGSAASDEPSPGPAAASAPSAPQQAFPYMPLDSSMTAVGRALGLSTKAATAGDLQRLVQQLMATNRKQLDSAAAMSGKMHGKTILLDNPAAQLSATKALRAARSGPSMRRLHRQLFPASPAVSYAALRPLHELWRSYSASVLEASSAPEATLLQVDLHGALLHVTRARQAGHVGTAGIVLKDTRNAFHIVTESKVTRVVPKAGAMFRCTVGSSTFELHGSNLSAAMGT